LAVDDGDNVRSQYVVFFIIANLRTLLANMLISDHMSLMAEACSRDIQRLHHFIETVLGDMHGRFRQQSF